MNYKRHLYLRNLSTILIPFMIPLVFLGTLSFIISERLITQRNDVELSTITTNARARFDYPFMDIDGLIRTFDTYPSIINVVSSVLNKESYSLDEVRSLNSIISSLNSILNTKSYFQSIYIYYDNPYGKFLSLDNGIVKKEEYWDSEWMDALDDVGQETNFHTIRRTIKQAKYDPHGVDVITVITATSSIKGCIVFNLKVSYFQKVIEDLKNTGGVSIGIFDGLKDNLIFSDEHAESLPPAKETDDGNVIRIQGGLFIPRIISSEYSDWSYLVMLDMKEAYRPLSIVYCIILSIIASSVIAGILIASYISRKNIKWIQDIVDLISETGNFKTGAPKIRDFYSSIVQNILQVFMETQYLKAERKSLELTALQAQINPHFLYNTLHCIYWETIKVGNGRSSASDMLEELSDILEYSISNPLETVSLEDEIEYTKDYISIQQHRFPGAFDVEWNIDDDVLNIKVMKLLFQPIIENSISHGFKGLDRKGKIIVSVSKTEGRLLVVISDNGKGIDAENLGKIREMVKRCKDFDSDGIGLNNTVKRLILAYPDSCSFNIDSMVDEGTVVTIAVTLQDEC